MMSLVAVVSVKAWLPAELSPLILEIVVATLVVAAEVVTLVISERAAASAAVPE